MQTKRWIMLLFLLFTLSLLAACSTDTPDTGEDEDASEGETDSQTDEESEGDESTEADQGSAGVAIAGPSQISGTIEVTNSLIIGVYFFENFAFLEDLTGFINRDFEYEQPLEAQILGPVTVDEEGAYSYSINLPAAPVNPYNDVDNDGEDDTGVQIWQIVMYTNLFDDPFLKEDETGGWSTVYTSAHIDSENEDELDGGTILVYAPDGDQAFPTGFGDDGLLFTEDDPTGPISAGYTLVNMDEEPFTFSQDTDADVTLLEGDIVVNDFSEMGWLEAFEALHEKASREYPFTDIKGIDWDALHDEFAPRVEAAEDAGDEEAYYLAMRDYAWSIPDGHVGLVGNDFGLFAQDTSGSYGFAIYGLDDGSVIANIVNEGGPAAEAGMEWGATILEWGGQPIDEAVAEVRPWSLPFSTDHSLILQQWRYLTFAPLGTEIEVTFQNPGAASPTTATLTAIDDNNAILTRTSFFYGYDSTALPVVYEILDSGYGYIAINTLSDELNLTIRLWERAIEVMAASEVPGIIIDMRQNTGGAPIGTALVTPFIDERMEFYVDYYYSDTTGELETFRPPSYAEPDPDLSYDGSVAVLVSPACSSACEDVSYVFSQLEQTRVIGYWPTNGIFGEVGRGQYTLPGDYSFQIPTGLTTDLEGNLVIEGTGVVPDITVPRTLETLQRQYVEDEDVVLTIAQEVLDQPLGGGITPTSGPAFDSDFDLVDALIAGESLMADRVREEYSDEELANFEDGQVFPYTVALGRTTDLIWFYAWCTSTEEQLADNWSKIDLTFTINGEDIPLDEFGVYEGDDFGGPCRIYYTRLGDFGVGEHHLVQTITFTAPFNDGSFDYPAGTHIFDYGVFVARE